MSETRITYEGTGETVWIRRQAESDNIVIGHNFGGAVVLDPKMARQVAWVIIGMTDPDLKR